jgi:hypothetical protein
MIDLTDSEQERLCKFCEENIINCGSVTSTFICEGSFCDEAFDMFIEEYIKFFRKLKLKEIENGRK